MAFGTRMGFQKRRSGLQTDDLEQGTKVRLWNATVAHLGFTPNLGWGGNNETFSNADFRPVAESIFDRILRRPYSEIPGTSGFLSTVQSWFIYDSKWWNAMELLELLAPLEGESRQRRDHTHLRWYYPIAKGFRQAINAVFAEELVGYRFVGNEILPVTDPAEVRSLEDSMSSDVKPVADHFAKAASLLAQKGQTDFSESVAQAISGVEAAAKFVTGRDSDVLSGMLQTLQARHGAHPALAEVFKKMYGWASDGGIRHGKKESDAPVDRDLAKCIIVMCSAFANLLVTSKA